MMNAGDWDTGLSAGAETVLHEIPTEGCDAWWIAPATREELEDAGLVATWRDRDGCLMIRPV